MRRTAGPSAAVDNGPPWGHNTGTRQAGPDDRVGRDLHDAWQLAYVVVADGDLATRAVTTAFLDSRPGDAGSPPSGLELLAATLRLSLTRAAESPERADYESAVTTALWQLPAAQRAALWLAKVNELDSSGLAAVLGLTTANAEHVASRATEWLDVALDHESGPLCPFESNLDDFIHGTLPDLESDELAEHLPDCSTCKTKVRAFEELSDLKAVLIAAVPAAPAWLNAQTLAQQERTAPTGRPSTLVESTGRVPAVRTLAACCAALLLVGLIGVTLVHGHKAGDPPPVDPSAIPAGSAGNPASPGLGVSSSAGASDPSPETVTTIMVTTTSIPAVTFPTIPAGGSHKSKR